MYTLKDSASEATYEKSITIKTNSLKFTPKCIENHYKIRAKSKQIREQYPNAGNLVDELPLRGAAIAVDHEEIGLVESAVGGGEEMHGGLIVQIDGALDEVTCESVVDGEDPVEEGGEDREAADFGGEGGGEVVRDGGGEGYVEGEEGAEEEAQSLH